MGQDKTLIDTLQRVQEHAETGVMLINGSHDETSIRYRDLYTRARRVLHVLQKKGLRPRQELVLQVQEEQVFLDVFWACVLGGIVPVPSTVGTTAEHRLKLVQIWNVLQQPMLVTTADGWQHFVAHMDKQPAVREMESRLIYTDELVRAAALPDAPLGDLYEATPEEIAFIQFSSGSTGDPKGVVLTHANVVSNLAAIVAGVRAGAGDSVLSWMPLTHDMGLIGMHLMALYASLPFYLIPTPLFVRRPALWLAKISEHRVTLTSSPNFGYKLFLTTFKPARAAEWDLSALRVIFNGAEPISYELCNRFLDDLAPYGLRRTAMFPVYGLAEATVGAVFPAPGEEMRQVRVDRRTLVLGGRVEEVTEPESHMYESSFVDVGTPIRELELRICGEAGEVLDEMHVGYIQICGASVTPGYYNNPEATELVRTADGWLNTGDLGFLREGRLVVTGRAKDILFVNGQNIYPHDVERVAEGIEGIELGKVAVTGVFDPTLQRDLILLFVAFKHHLREFAPLALQLKRYIARLVGLQLDHVLPVRAIPKTTSGKVQRYKLGEQFQSGEFDMTLADLQVYMQELEAAVQVIPPRNEVEATILGLWQEVLEQESISVEDNFFELGGKSTLVAQIVGQLEALYPQRVQISDPYSLPTIRQMADHILATPRAVTLKPVQFPQAYLAPPHEVGGIETLHARVPAPIVELLRQLASEMQGSLLDLLALVFANLLTQVTAKASVQLSVVIEDDQVAALELDLSAVESLSDALHHVREQLATPRELIAFSELLGMARREEEQGILTCFFHRETRVGHVEWLQVFDLVCWVEEFEDGLRLACQFAGRRLRAAKMKELLTLYVKLLLHLAGKSSSGRE
ncbi:non-ribosomal peptide synthetase [Tumebacillus permanentifrigoris]|uniref:Acyl-CoA synthetase (AMP-forming)/AMP-acid ligase II n=1 Tax=Tumebacillus permanentifrigoris TaxID=378543 RepID=A0A316D545_9BACL|nr:non-ribosomal peptide synthetase [Tumebacillus permanentifrigoris]PWK07932.1 acyl-CoA synthetase (AMP-forming)/AMP-acid ligase II [Tumebacillus permanentifrigoris]